MTVGMSLSYRDERVVALRRASRGSGSARERRPGVWEVRVVVGFDADRNRSIQRSFTVYGDHAAAVRRRSELVETFGVRRVERYAATATLTLGELLERYVVAPHVWAPASFASARYVVGRLVVDGVASERLVVFTPGVMQSAIRRWQQAGLSVASVSARWLMVRSALSWACAEGLLRVNPLGGMRGRARPAPRQHHTLGEVRLLLTVARERVALAEAALAARPASPRALQRLFAAGQDLLLVRLAADSGARRGELAGLRHADLDGRVLTIERGLSAGDLGPTKQRRTRRLTLSAGTVEMIERHRAVWVERGFAPAADWLFAPTARRASFMTSGALSHRFTRLGAAAGVARPALHRLRHGLATYLVDEGKVLKAQVRLGHADPSTTLRHYSHGVALDDQDVADEIDRLLAVDAWA